MENTAFHRDPVFFGVSDSLGMYIYIHSIYGLKGELQEPPKKKLAKSWIPSDFPYAMH